MYSQMFTRENPAAPTPYTLHTTPLDMLSILYTAASVAFSAPDAIAAAPVSVLGCTEAL